MNSLASRSLVLVLLAAAFSACRTAPSVPFRADDELEHAVDVAPAQGRSELWVSYQIVVDGVDGESTNYRAEEPCVYFKLTLPAGAHSLALRLDYRSPTHRVRTKTPIDLQVELEAGVAYRLLDLSSEDLGQRSFTPFLLEGAPSDQKLELVAD